MIMINKQSNSNWKRRLFDFYRSVEERIFYLKFSWFLVK